MYEYDLRSIFKYQLTLLSPKHIFFNALYLNSQTIAADPNLFIFK